MNKIIISILLFTFFIIHSQTHIKGNLLSSLVLIPNVGKETSVGENSTHQFDFTGSFLKSIYGKPSQFYIFVPEYRFYFNKKIEGLYIGGHVGATIFNFQKRTNFDIDFCQKRYKYVIVTTLGFQKKINERLNNEFFTGGGHHEGFYKGYHIDSNERYDSSKDFNKSGEWIQHRGGVSILFKLNDLKVFS